MQEPPTWPALLQLPEDQYTGDLNEGGPTAVDGFDVSSAAMLYTGNDRQAADALMTAIFTRNQSIGRIFYAFLEE